MKNNNNYAKNDYNRLSISEQELADNPTPRVPLCLCLDVSGSMGGIISETNMMKIEALNEGIELLYNCIKSDDTARYSADISIVTFSDTAKVYENYSNVDSKSVPRLVTEGGTVLGAGIEKSLAILAKRKEEYKENGVDYYQPWLVIMTDGETCYESDVERLGVKLQEMEDKKKLTVFPIGVGDDADMELISKLSHRGACRLNEAKFEELFKWLSQSISNVATSVKDSKVALPKVTWAEV